MTIALFLYVLVLVLPQSPITATPRDLLDGIWKEPSIMITHPLATISSKTTIDAEATAGAGVIIRVELWADGKLLSASVSGLQTASARIHVNHWNPRGKGRHHIEAQVWDSLGRTVLSTLVVTRL